MRRVLISVLAAFSIGAAAVGLATAGNGYSLRCVPQETRTAPDRLVELDIHLLDNGAFDRITYFAANGASYDRTQQYNGIAYHDEQSGFFWRGKLRSNPNVEIVGQFVNYDGRLHYTESIRNVTKSPADTTLIVSDCGSYAPAAPVASSSPAPQSDGELSRDIRAYLTCVNKAVMGLAMATPDRADDVIAAARGLCFQERSAIIARANALGHNG